MFSIIPFMLTGTQRSRGATMINIITLTGTQRSRGAIMFNIIRFSWVGFFFVLFLCVCVCACVGSVCLCVGARVHVRARVFSVFWRATEACVSTGAWTRQDSQWFRGCGWLMVQQGEPRAYFAVARMAGPDGCPAVRLSVPWAHVFWILCRVRLLGETLILSAIMHSYMMLLN